MDVPVVARVLVCSFCRREVDTRIGGYWFLLFEERGRVLFPDAPSRNSGVPRPSDLKTVLCSGCGRRLREQLESLGICLEVPAYVAS